MISHLIFDFFGTLVVYSPSRTSQGYARSHQFYISKGGQLDYSAFVECWASAFSELDKATADSHREYSMAEAAEAFRRRASFATRPSIVTELASSYLGEWSAGVRYLDGVSSMLRRLKRRFDLSIITNTHDLDPVPSHLQRLGVDPLFSQVVTSIGFGKRKPSPSIFEFALRELSVSPDQCIYIGDSHGPDFEGPRAVGIRAVLVDLDGTAPVGHDERVGSILELEALVAAV